MSGLGPSSPSSAEPRRGVTGATSRSAPTPVRFSHPGATRPGAARGGVGRRVRGAALPGSNGPGLCTSSYGSIRSDGTGDGPGRRLILAASIEGIDLGVHPQVLQREATTPLMATPTAPATRRARGELFVGGKIRMVCSLKFQPRPGQPNIKIRREIKEKESVSCVYGASVGYLPSCIPSRLYIFAHRARLRCPTSEAVPASQPAAALELAVLGQLLLRHEHGARDVDDGRKGVDHTVHGLLRA